MSAPSFVALDVETANRHRGSICCIGLAVVDHGHIVRTEQWLTRPPTGLDEFEGINIGIHGIHADDVAGAPGFLERLDGLLDIVDERPLVAHNASFDTSALVQACQAENREVPALAYACSRDMAKRVITSDSHALDVLCSQLGIELDHHRAGADAVACAQLTMRIADTLDADDLPSLLQLLGMHFQTLGDPARQRPQRSGGHFRYAHVDEMPDANVDGDVNHPLYGQTVVFTGMFQMPKEALWEMVAETGGIPGQNVTKRTTILVVGDGFTDDLKWHHSGKTEKALALRTKGQPIEILNEMQIMQALGPAILIDAGSDWS